MPIIHFFLIDYQDKTLCYFYKLYAPLQANCPQLADNFIEDLYIADIQRVVAQSKKRVCHKSVTHPFLFFAFSQIRNL